MRPHTMEEAVIASFDKDAGALRVTTDANPEAPMPTKGTMDEVIRKSFDKDAGALRITGAAPAPTSGAGVPESGPGGDEAARGTEYYDTSVDPPVVYKQVAADPTNPKWVPLNVGDVTA